MSCPDPLKGRGDGARVALVGGGVMGCTLAYALARRGVSVTLFERAPTGSAGASGVPVALLNPHRGRSARASDFDLGALRAMWALVDEVASDGFDTGVHRSGVVRIASNARQARRWAKLPGVRGFGAENAPQAISRSGFHTPFGGFIVPAGGWLEPRRWLGALTRAACARGAQVIRGCEVSGVSRLPEGYGLMTSRGELRAAAVVLCTGAEALPTGLPAGLVPLPEIARVAGEVVGLSVATPPAYPLAGAVYGAWTAGTFYLGGNHRPAGTIDEDAPVQLQRAGSWFLPALGDASQESLWSGVRAKTEDNLPVVLELFPNLWFAGALSGRGFLCAALLAGALAEGLARRFLAAGR